MAVRHEEKIHTHTHERNALAKSFLIGGARRHGAHRTLSDGGEFSAAAAGVLINLFIPTLFGGDFM